MAGLFGNYNGRTSYASGYPEPPDIYLSIGVQVDPDSGEFKRDGNGAIVWAERDTGLLIRWDEIEYLDFYAFDPGEA